MKKIINKTTMAIIIALTMLLALFGGLFLVNRGVADAAGESVVVKIQAFEVDGSGNITSDEVTSFSSGKAFKVKVTVQSTLSGNFDSLTLNIGPTNAAHDGFDATKCGYLTFVPATTRALTKKSSNISKTTDFPDNSKSYTTGFETRGFLLISIANFNGKTLPCTDELTFEFGLTVNAGVPDGTEFNIGIMETAANLYSYTSGSSAPIIYANDAQFGVEPLAFTVKEPSNVNTLDTLKGGQGEAESDLSTIDLTDPDNLAITVTDLTKPISLKPGTTDANAKVSLKPTSDTSATPVAIGKDAIGNIAIPDDGKITIIVTAENGDVKEYKLTVTVVGGKLTALTVTTDSTETGVTKNGLKETFDATTLAYTVYVPNDQAKKATFNATVSTGHSEDANVTLTKTGSCTAPATAASAADFDVTGIEDNDTLTIKVTASSGSTNSEKEYVITFDVVDTDATLKTITVVGSTTNKTFENNAAKATANTVDYYYVIAGETNASSDVTLEANSTIAAVQLDGTDYTAAKTLTAGEHTISIAAEAGNTKTYKFYLKNYIALQLKAGVEADFIMEEVTATNVYRRAYKEKSIVHGKDDLDYERLVIGQIPDRTSINTFLDNFDASARTSIVLYNADGDKVFDKGSAAGTFTADMLDSQDSGCAVGTSWKLEYVLAGNVEETIYLSVLGDLNGDGLANALDVPVFGNIIKEITATMEKFNNNVEFRLATYISNSGVITGGQKMITAAEIPYMGRHIRNVKPLSDQFYQAS